jgi:hypothetical protein
MKCTIESLQSFDEFIVWDHIHSQVSFGDSPSQASHLRNLFLNPPVADNLIHHTGPYQSVKNNSGSENDCHWAVRLPLGEHQNIDVIGFPVSLIFELPFDRVWYLDMISWS